MQKRTPMTSSQEDYLETIYHITAEKQGVRAKDIAREMKVKASSVTGALRVLSDKGLINYEPYGVITMTPEGRDVAEEVVRRHEVLELLAGMDLVPGNIIEIEESQGDTLEVRVKGYHRSLRLDDAQRVLVYPL